MTEPKMRRAIQWQTKDCIKCGKPAKVHGGAVRLGRSWVLAGWCHGCKRLTWFHGDYSPKMGRERVK